MIYFFNAEQKYRETPLPKIYGASWDGSSSTKWTRTDFASEFSDPNPYYSGMSGSPSSPFDDILPWKGMVVSEDSEAGTVVAIPKFYYKLTYADESNNTGLKIQISEANFDGALVSPAHQDRGDGSGERDVVYVGRYHCDTSTKKSKTGVKPYVNATRSTMRSAIHNLGSKIWQMDFLTRFTIWLLYIVEFADWNSQNCIGYGCGNNSATENMGYTDNMPYHTGTMLSSKTTYGVGTQYRNIEGLWDNVFDWLDGAYYNSNGLNIILNPANFSDSSGGTLVGLPTNGYPSKFAISNGVFYPTESNGSDSTFSCDYWSFSASGPCLYGGGYYNQGLGHGLFCVNRYSTSGSNAGLGCRLLKFP